METAASLDWSTITAAVGIGSLLTVGLQHLLADRSKKRAARIAERKEAFIGFLEAWRDQDQEGVTQNNRFEVGHWILRCELVGSSSLCAALDKWNDSTPSTPERGKALQELKLAMKRDLR